MAHDLKYLFFFSRFFSVFLIKGLGEGSTDFPVLELKAGQIRGKRESVSRGQDADLFLGIPYAQPPLGEQRFAVPRPAKPWKGILDATKYAAHCPQGETLERGILAGNY